ncbi:MgtC/SapB family protein [Dokdonella fugitiva]|jgi:putative Mg2+ transporter-C (MgtC) family protein|uniref:Protein MgtC n=1 Tax=Dokdonella fugitiva TaxID=328517 RepID=A0A4R2I6K1_9GAMM|nr:MgtC/SapB family protein [Dokdonella fugitiva]MBA8884324.1 putative Mg2+ transporter-C (MgtC) family protein [Dokdonella fugitiva]TCO39931.1 putative Mg2+ transporter-C (MgtC) family protein [Dokdonella fugitiva]
MNFEDIGTIALRLGLAVVVGGLVGLNRDLHRKPAGVRTHALVSLGTALMVIAILPPGSSLDLRVDALSRVIQGVLTGIGFLGAGVILHDTGNGRVRGLTTAATIWVTALIGVACGAGQYAAIAIAFVFGALAVLFGGSIERAFRRRFPDRAGSDPPPS